MANEHQFPTIRDMRDRLTDLVDLGLGDFPVQVIVVPGSTIVATARTIHPDQADGPLPLMIEFAGREGRMATLMVSADFLEKPRKPQLSIVKN